MCSVSFWITQESHSEHRHITNTLWDKILHKWQFIFSHSPYTDRQLDICKLPIPFKLQPTAHLWVFFLLWKTFITCDSSGHKGWLKTFLSTARREQFKKCPPSRQLYLRSIYNCYEYSWDLGASKERWIQKYKILNELLGLWYRKDAQNALSIQLQECKNDPSLFQT